MTTARVLTVGSALVLTTALAAFTSVTSVAEAWEMQFIQTPTKWAASVSATNALPEYPRPQLARPNWENLNGLWSYAITRLGAQIPKRYQGTILVPYPIESALSGVKRALQPDELLWYRRTFEVTSKPSGGRVLLHFGAVDYRATIYVNNREVGSHIGGYQAFTFDITDALGDRKNELVVKVFDPTDTGINPHGKQSLHPRDTRYTSTSGIWQTVWLETVPAVYIERLTTTPDVDRSELWLDVRLSAGPTSGTSSGYTIQAIAREGSETVASESVHGATALRIPHPQLWSPGNPFLYSLEVRLLKAGLVVDEVSSYFGMRKVEVKEDARGVERIFLNGHYTYNLGVLDQGFWPDGLYTAPVDAAMEFDIRAIKSMGFNTIRKHLKVEPERWYYYCDKLGILVWQDMVAPAGDSIQARSEFEGEAAATLIQLHNHPSIVTWVLFNEGWGAYDQERLGRWIKSQDRSRLVDAHSGPNVRHLAEWERHLDPSTLAKVLAGDTDPVFSELRSGGFHDPTSWVASDFTDIHVYPNPQLPPGETGKARVLGEYGGIGVLIVGHTWNDLPGFGYIQVKPAEMADAYSGMVERLKTLESEGLSGSIYTQPFDVEQEQNGLMTYDRAVLKMPLSELVRSNATLVRRDPDYGTTGVVFEHTEKITPRAQRYAELLAKYEKGLTSPSLLRHLILLAIERGDQVHATEAINDLIPQLPQPYSKDTWAFILATTKTSQDRGFELLRTRASEIDTLVGESAAEKVIRDVIGREELQPHVSNGNSIPDWSALELSISKKYGELGMEEVHGAEMIYYLGKHDWLNFAKYFVSYYRTAASRSEFSINLLAYVVFQYVNDPSALESAIEAVQVSLNSEKVRGESEPTEIDTYANLLYKVGKNREALEWEKRAARISEGRDPDIEEHLKKMNSGEPTWPPS